MGGDRERGDLTQITQINAGRDSQAPRTVEHERLDGLRRLLAIIVK